MTTIECADDALQRRELELPFSWADFVACDPRCAHHFALAPAGETPATPTLWMLPLSRAARSQHRAVRGVYAAHYDEPGRLPDVVVQMKIIPLARDQHAPIGRRDPVRRRFSSDLYDLVVDRSHYQIHRKKTLGPR